MSVVKKIRSGVVTPNEKGEIEVGDNHEIVLPGEIVLPDRENNEILKESDGMIV